MESCIINSMTERGTVVYDFVIDKISRVQNKALLKLYTAVSQFM